jgi:transcriptional regulator with XRE-family HTH domain
MDREGLRQALGALRAKRGRTQEEVARRMGVNPSYISQIENSPKTPSVDVLERWAAALDVRLDYVLVGADVELPTDAEIRSIIAALVRAGPAHLTAARKRTLRAMLQEWGVLDEHDE